MALECQEVGEASPKNYFTNPWGKEITGPSTRDLFPSTSSKPNSHKKSQNKLVIPKLVSAFPSKKVETKSGSMGTDDASPNGDHRSFTDLPSTLVSEILRRLDAKEPGIVSCVSTLLHSLASDHQGWKDFYCNRWSPPLDLNVSPVSGSPNQKSWKELFVEREFRSKSFMGRFSIDALHGHTEDVHVVFLLQSTKLIFIGGYDSVIRMWDMEEGLSVAVSRPLGCIIQAIAADSELLVAGGTDAFLQCWRAIEGNPHLFDITSSTMSQNYDFHLWGHEGPITCLALDSSRIYSGSWDMSVRVCDRAQLKCLTTLRHGDWVWALAPRGGTIASTTGKDVYVWDIERGDPISVISNAHVGNAHSLTRSHLGDLLFTGGEDGVIHIFEIAENYDDEDVRPAATWVPHAGLHSLAFEFPWLVSSSSDGRLALIDMRKLLKSSQCSLSRQCFRVKQSVDVVKPPQRMLHGFGCNLFSVDIGADRIVCGGEEGVVRVWNFSQALEIEERVQALRSIRQENRMRWCKAQIEMNGNTRRTDQCSVAAKRNRLNGDRNGVWHSKRGVSGKLKPKGLEIGISIAHFNFSTLISLKVVE